MIPVESNLTVFNNTQATEVRQILPGILSKPTIENMNNYIKPSIFPIIFEEIYVRQTYSSENNKKSLQMDEMNVILPLILVQQ